MSYFSYKNNILYCEKVKISDIADKYGTPAYIYSKKTLSENFDAYANAFDKKSGLICFSVKSLSNLSILKFLSEINSLEFPAAEVTSNAASWEETIL